MIVFLKLWKILLLYFDYNDAIRSKFVTWHGSSAVATWVRLWPVWIIISHPTAIHRFTRFRLGAQEWLWDWSMMSFVHQQSITAIYQTSCKRHRSSYIVNKPVVDQSYIKWNGLQPAWRRLQITHINTTQEAAPHALYILMVKYYRFLHLPRRHMILLNTRAT